MCTGGTGISNDDAPGCGCEPDGKASPSGDVPQQGDADRAEDVLAEADRDDAEDAAHDDADGPDLAVDDGPGDPAPRARGGAIGATTVTDDAASGAGSNGAGQPQSINQSGPVRSCAVSRQSFPVVDLIRFVRAPDGTIVPDIAQKLPGRGVWVEASRGAVELAQKKNAFAKSLKKPCVAPPDLAARVEVLLVRRLIDGLGLANKAGLVVGGFAKIAASIESHDIIALFHGIDAARDGVEKLDRRLNTARNQAVVEGSAGRRSGGQGGGDLDSVIIRELTIDEMSLAIGRPNVVHAGLRSGGATLRLLETAKRLRRFRASRA